MQQYAEGIYFAGGYIYNRHMAGKDSDKEIFRSKEESSILFREGFYYIKYFKKEGDVATKITIKQEAGTTKYQLKEIVDKEVKRAEEFNKKEALEYLGKDPSLKFAYEHLKNEKRLKRPGSKKKAASKKAGSSKKKKPANTASKKKKRST